MCNHLERKERMRLRETHPLVGDAKGAWPLLRSQSGVVVVAIELIEVETHHVSASVGF